MKKTITLFFVLFIAIINGFGQDGQTKVKSRLQNPKIDTRIDNISYWTELAKKGIVPFNPDVPVPQAQPVPTKDGTRNTDQMSTDVVVHDETGVTQSENSVFVDPSDSQHVLNSNNSETGGGIYGADYFNSSDEGQNWTGSKTGAGGSNKGDPAACISLSGRQYIGFITTARGQGIAYSDNGTSWTPVTVAAGVTSPDLLDKNHMIVDNTNSIYSGNVYCAWTCFVSGNANDADIVFSRSTNNGVSWSAGLNISNAIAAGNHNQGVNIQTGPSGQVYCTWAVYDNWGPTYNETAIGFAKSTNGGASFAAATRIHNSIKGIREPATPTVNPTGKNMRVNSFPSMAVDVSGGPNNGNIYVVWANIGVPGVNTGTNVSVYCMRSTNGGTSWNTPVRVNQGTSANDYASFEPWITCDPVSGKLYCVFYDDRNLGASSTAVETWMAFSEDGGVTWKDIRVSDVSFTPSPIPGLAAGYFGDYLGITANNNRVYPCWTDNRSGRALTYVSPLQFGDYCIATGGCDEYISNVTIGSINNSSACEGYQNFTTLSTNIPVNSSNDIIVSNGHGYLSDQCGIWVDWNSDGDFSDAGETISVGGTPGVGSYTATIAPPSGTTLGSKTMRVRITYSGTVDPCGSTTYGEVEDYTINITSALPNYWVGSFNHYWHNAANWSLGHIPTAIENTYITNAGNQPVYVDTYPGIPAEECKSLIIQSGGALQVWGMTLNLDAAMYISGQLTMNNSAGIINVAGNWNNYVGAAGFTAGPGRVVFNGGNYQQYCSDETFNILEVNKPLGGALRMNGTNVVCAAYDWTAGAVDVLSGSFTANDLLDNGISGAFYNNDGGTINLTNSATNTWVDLNGELHLYGGTMNVTGTVSDWPYSHDALIEMSAGVLDFRTCGINVNNSFGHLLTTNITGGTIRMAGSFGGSRADFTPSGGTIEFYGPADATISLSNGCTFNDVLINKSATRPQGPDAGQGLVYNRNGQILEAAPLANNVTLATNFTATNNLSISNGSFVLNGWQANVNHYCHVYGSLIMSNAADKLYVGTNSYDHLEFHAGSNSTISAGAIYPASWVWSSGAATVAGGTGNTIYFTGSNYAGIEVDGPGSIFGNIDVNRTSGNLRLYSTSGIPVELAGTFNLHAANVLDMQNFAMVIHGIVTDNATSTIYLYNGPGKSLHHEQLNANGVDMSAKSPTVAGSLTIDTDFNLKGLLDIADGSVLVHGKFSAASTSSILINGGSLIGDAPYHAVKGWESLNGNLTMASGLFEITNNSIYLGATATTDISGGTLRTGGAFGASNAGTFNPTGGVVEVIGNSTDNNLFCGNGNYYYNLLINRPPGVISYIQIYDIIVKNDLTIQSGVLVANNRTINVGHNWSNAVGTSGFNEGNGTVVFDGANAADLLTPETFYNLTLNKTYASYDGLEVMQNVSVLNDLHIIDGTMKMRSPASLNVTGNLTIDLNAGLNASDGYGPQIYVGKDWSDLNTSYTVEKGFHPGTLSQVTFNGSVDQSLSTSCPQEDFYNLTIDKSAGKFRSIDNVQCWGNILISNGAWEDAVSGLSHTVYGNFTVASTGSFLTTFVNNTVEFKGSFNTSLTYSGAAGYFRNLLVNKSAANFVTLHTSASCQNGGNLTVNTGTFSLAGNYLSVFGNIGVNNTGVLSLPAGSSLVLSDTKSMNINLGGRLDILGTSGSPVTIAANVITARYALNVNTGGTIAAEYCLFKNTGANGVYVASGSTVDPAHTFKGCTFQDGATGGTMLTINNNQVMTVRNAVFPANTWSGASNVSKTVNSGHVYFVDFSGGFSGEAYDADGFNLLDWVPTLTATPAATPGAICAGSSSQLNAAAAGGLGPYLYAWSPATSLSNTNIFNPVASPATSTTYAVTVTDALGTTTNNSVALTVNPVLAAGVSISASANPSPPGNYVTFTATPSNGGASPSYQWKKNSSNVGTGLPTYSDNLLSYNDKISCILTSNYACPSGNPATSNIINMIIVDANKTVSGTIPASTTVCFDAINTITVAGPAGTFTVQSGGIAKMIAGVNIRYLYGTTVLTGGYMHGWITSNNGYCGSLSPAMVAAEVTGVEGTQELIPMSGSPARKFTVYPNPNTGVFTLINLGENITGKVQAELFNMRGDRIYTTSYSGEKSHIFTLRDLPAGLYFVKVMADDHVESFKLVVSR